MAGPKHSEGAACGVSMNPWTRIHALETELRARNEELTRLRIAQSILDNSEDLVFAVDRELRFVFANPITIAYGTRALGCSEKQFLSKRLVDIAAAEAMRGSAIFNASFDELYRLFDAAEPRYLESSVRVEGVLVWLGVWLFPVFDGAGKVTAMTAMARNITEQIEVRIALANEKERWAVTLASVGDAVITTDTNGRVSILNRAAEALTGWGRRDAPGQPLECVFNIIDEVSRLPGENPVSALLSMDGLAGVPVEITDIILVSKDRRETLVSGTCAPIRHAEQGVIGAVLVFRDVSRQKAAEEEMHRVQKLESVGLLAGGIAHDFNNILTSVMGNLSLVQRWARGNQAIASRLADAEKAVVQAQSLTNQLLTFSKGGAPIKTLASVRTIIKESAAFSLIGSAVQRVIDIPDNLWRVEVDEGQIAQVIQNLVINADQAMPNGGTVYISATNRLLAEEDGLPLCPGQYVVITVLDQGVGIPPHLLDRVFDPYFTTKRDGTGLGLATTHSIIRRHGGHITVESSENNGTRFSVYLPATEERISSDFIHEYLPELQRGRVLVMDDEREIQEVAAAVLKELGFEVETAGDGREALALYGRRLREGRRFDAVIMDLTVPGGLGGKESLSLLKKADPTAKAIVSSGYSTDPVMSEYRTFGFDGRMTKPYGIDQMADVLRRVLGRKSA